MKAINKIEYLIDSLKEISKCEGAYSMDKLEHASNTIKNMRDIALKAIEEVETI